MAKIKYTDRHINISLLILNCVLIVATICGIFLSIKSCNDKENIEKIMQSKIDAINKALEGDFELKNIL